MDAMQVPEKRCTKCGEYFPATAEYFYRNGARRDGLDTWCRACRRENARTWYAANTQRARENSHAWYIANADRERARARTRYVANRERDNMKSRIYRAAHLERIREYNRAYRAANLERERERNRTWREANRESARERSRTWRVANPERQRIQKQIKRARKRGLPNDFTAEQARFAIEFWHGCCAYCGRQFHDIFGERTLAFDHYIPLSSPDCPGTTAGNMLPVCHGVDGCNTTKNARDPEEWLMSRFGKRAARKKLAEIEAYFEIVRTFGEGVSNGT